ncbi:MAG: FAD-binding protein [Synergistaceae bacterium]|nr:FAD-binding protein [Synergistaceae bacterium]
MANLFTYGRVDETVINELVSAICSNNVSTDKDKCATYSRDEVPSNFYGREYSAEVLVFPETTEHVSSIMKIASKHKVPVTPRGAGTGLSGGALPVHGGIVMSFEKMNKLLELDHKNLTITVEPGVVTSEITAMATENNLFYAGDPCSGDSSYIGGNIAENAGGNKVIKYGAPGAQVLALEVVLPDGSITWFGGKRLKDATGFNFVQLMVGSEGVLGVITKAVLKLLPLSRYSVDLLAAFKDTATAIAFVPQIVKEGGLIPSSIEFMDKKALSLVKKYLNTEVPAGEAGAVLIIELEDNDMEQLEKIYEKIGKLSQKHGAYEVYVADTRSTKDRVWQARKSIAEAVSTSYTKYTKEDLVVPTDKVPALLEAIEEICTSHKLEWSAYGHAGDGNMHCSIIAPETTDWHDVLTTVQCELYPKVLDMGGTLSGEHGIGFKRKGYMKYFMDESQIELIKRVKLAFDPQNILNPGKMVDWN